MKNFMSFEIMSFAIGTELGKAFRLGLFSSISRRRTLRLLVCEYASGGGAAEGSVPSDVLSEGFGMLRSLISDFKDAGHNVTTLLNSGLAAYNPPLDADYVIPVSSWPVAKTLIESVARSFDAAHFIGPETSQISQSLIRIAEEAGLTLLNCSASAIEGVADKLMINRSLKKQGIKTPETVMLSTIDEVEETKQALKDCLNFPMVFKPLDGASCCGLSIVRNEPQIAGAIAKIRKESRGKNFVAQDYIQGIPASVSLITTGNEALPISLNKQILSLAGPESNSKYVGGVVPLDSPFIDEAFDLAKDTVESFRDLRGYVGVDLVLTERGPVVIEVNPRLTTSYIGLKLAVNSNIGQAIVEAVLQGYLPEDIQVAGYSCFSKIEVPSPTVVALQDSYEIEGLVSPPFPMGDEKTHALLLCHSSTLNESVKELSEAEKSFLRKFGRE